MACEAGLRHRNLASREEETNVPFCSDNCRTSNVPGSACDIETDIFWRNVEWHIRYKGMNFVHPVKSPEQLQLCLNARKFYEHSKS
jgi:hypothetical protein